MAFTVGLLCPVDDKIMGNIIKLLGISAVISLLFGIVQAYYLGADILLSAGYPSGEGGGRLLKYSFYIGGILSITTILWSVFKTPEIPPTSEELAEINHTKSLAVAERIAKPFTEIKSAIKDMPPFMWKLGAVYLFQWYALFVYWQYITPLFKLTMGYSTSEAASQSAQMSLTYNIVTMVVALALVPLTLKFGGKKIYAYSLVGTGLSLLAIPYISDSLLVLLPMVLFGIGWAAMMGIPYTMVSKVVPQDRRGVYMGILNMMIVIPMGIETLTFGPIFKYLLGGNAINAMLFAGAFFIVAAILAMRLNVAVDEKE